MKILHTYECVANCFTDSPAGDGSLSFSTLSPALECPLIIWADAAIRYPTYIWDSPNPFTIHVPPEQQCIVFQLQEDASQERELETNVCEIV